MTAETTDGAILFVFGDEAAAAAHQTGSSSKAKEPAEPKPEQAEPLEQLRSAAQSPPAAQEEGPEPEAAYERTRGKKVKEAVMEAKVKDGAEKSGVYIMLAAAVPVPARIAGRISHSCCCSHEHAGNICIVPGLDMVQIVPAQLSVQAMSAAQAVSSCNDALNRRMQG